MKAILMSIRPEWVAKILNGEKTIEIRKKFPKDYVGWVYIYCTQIKKKHHHLIKSINPDIDDKICYEIDYYISSGDYLDYCLDEKVVARFWCDKVEEYVNGAKIVCGQPANFNTYKFILKDTCLTKDELYDYCEDLSFKAIHITKLEIFDKPKELSEFIICRERKHKCRQKFSDYPCKKCVSMNLLTRAPQSWCFIEV